MPDIPHLHPPDDALLAILFLEILYELITDTLLSTATDAKHHVETLQYNVPLFFLLGRKDSARATSSIAFTDPTLKGSEFCGGFIDV